MLFKSPEKVFKYEPYTTLTSDLLGLIRIKNSVSINPRSNLLGLICIKNLVRIHSDKCLELNQIKSV